jgi:hypothetical protein
MDWVMLCCASFSPFFFDKGARFGMDLILLIKGSSVVIERVPCRRKMLFGYAFSFPFPSACNPHPTARLFSLTLFFGRQKERNETNFVVFPTRSSLLISMIKLFLLKDEKFLINRLAIAFLPLVSPSSE